jgi:hypothetical protein
MDTRVSLHQVMSAVNAPADQITFAGPKVTSVSPRRLPLVANRSHRAMIVVTGTGFAGATSIRFVQGTHGIYVTSKYFTINAAGTQITLGEPDDLDTLIPPKLGPGPNYNLEIRVSLHQVMSGVNAPADQIVLHR